MFGAAVLSVAVFAGLTLLGLGSRARPIAAGVLLLSCVAVCVAVVITQDRSLKDVDRVINRLAEERAHSHESHGG